MASEVPNTPNFAPLILMSANAHTPLVLTSLETAMEVSDHRTGKKVNLELNPLSVVETDGYIP
jgi:hypothetical protein